MIGLLLPAAAAQGEANCPMRAPALVIPFPPGGIVDTTGRMLAERAQRHPGQNITIEKRPVVGPAPGAVPTAEITLRGNLIREAGIAPNE